MRSPIVFVVNRYALLAAAILLLSGCGGETSHRVTGKVTLDGSPLADAIVSFVPEDDQGKILLARTDSQGNYAAQQSNSMGGAEAGTYVVRITTFREGIPDADPPAPSVPEMAPARYNFETDLSVVVTPEDDVFDFVLRSDG